MEEVRAIAAWDAMTIDARVAWIHEHAQELAKLESEKDYESSRQAAIAIRQRAMDLYLFVLAFSPHQYGSVPGCRCEHIESDEDAANMLPCEELDLDQDRDYHVPLMTERERHIAEEIEYIELRCRSLETDTMLLSIRPARLLAKQILGKP